MNEYILILPLCIVAIVVVLLPILFHLISKPKKAGTLVINTTNPDKDVYSLNFDIPLGEIPKRKRIVFDVKIE